MASKNNNGHRENKRIINDVFVFVVVMTMFLSAVLLSEPTAGTGIGLRALIGGIYAATAITATYGVMKLLQIFPARISAVFLGSWVLLALVVI